MDKSTVTSKHGLASTARPDDAQVASFGSAAVGMGWQLAIVVLLPIVGGYQLDKRLHATPLWTLLGFVVALTGSILVIRRALTAFGNFSPLSGPESSVTKPDNINEANKERQL